MQLIQVCIWSVVIVTAENSTLTLPLHRPPAKQTDIQTSGRTNKRTKCPSKQSPPLLGKAYQLQRYDFLKQFFLTSNALIGINLSYSLNMARCQQRSQIQNEEYPSPLQNKKRPMSSSWRGKMQSDSGTGCYTLHLTLKFENVDQSR